MVIILFSKFLSINDFLRLFLLFDSFEVDLFKIAHLGILRLISQILPDISVLDSVDKKMWHHIRITYDLIVFKTRVRHFLAAGYEKININLYYI